MTALRTDETAWLEWRRAGVTATEVADAWAGTYGGLYGVVARKLGLTEVEQTAQMERGHRWQPVIADAVHVLTGFYVVGEEAWCEHPDHGRYRATVDGFLARELEVSLDEVVAGFECKTRDVQARPDRDRWRAQVEWQLFVTGLDRALLAEAVIDDTDDTLVSLRLEWIDADPFRAELLAEVADRILGHVDTGTLPEPDTASALDLVKELTAEADETAQVVELEELEEDLARFVELREALKAAEAERDTLEARIRDRIGPALAGTAPGFKVSLSRPTRVLTREAEAELLDARPDLGRLVLDRDRAKKEAPDLYEAVRKPAGARRLTVKRTGE